MLKISKSSRSGKRFGAILRQYHFILAIIIITVFLAFEALFLYRNFFLALNESRIVRELKQQAAIEALNIEGFNRVEEFYAQKQTAPQIDWDALRDPFQK